MSRHVSRVFIAFLVAAVAASPADAQRTKRKKKVEEPPPVQFTVNEPTRPFELSQAQVSIPKGTVVGEYGSGTIFCDGTLPISIELVSASLAMPDLQAIVAKEAEAAGYSLPDTGRNLFDTAEAVKPDLFIGAILNEMTINGCAEPSLSEPSPGKMTATMRLEWQVFDPLEKKLLLRTTTVGIGKASAEVSALVGATSRSAFQQAAKALLADPTFVAAVRKPSGANNNSVSGAASTATVAIARVPINTLPFQQQVPLLRPQVVTIKTPSGTGSGFFISEDLLLTNEHVIAGSSAVRLKLFGGREIGGLVIKSDARRDVALVRAEAAGGGRGLPLRLDDPLVGSEVFVIGSPLGEEQEGSVTSGIVSALRKENGPALDRGPFIQSDVAITNGNSGGPMFDDKGNVLGIADLSLRGRQNIPVDINFFVPIGDAMRALALEIVAPATSLAPVQTREGLR